MKSLLKILLTLIILNSLCLSCHKYPKDPFISFRKPDKRLEASTWQFTSYQINGVEHSHDFDSLLAPNTLTNCYLIMVDNSAIYSYYISRSSDNLYSLADNGTWHLSYDNKTIQFYSSANGVNFNNFYVQLFKSTITGSITWTTPAFNIVELYGKHLHISNNGVDIYFKKI
jgi:hypothetical protein